jgi:hypothetical protein
MKERLDRHQAHLSPDERRSLWNRVRPGAARAQREVTVRRWIASFGLAVACITIVAVVFTQRREERLRERNRRSAEAGLPRDGAIPSGPVSAGQVAVSSRPLNDRFVYRAPDVLQPFTNTRRDSLSTFALDVGAAGYGVVRRYVEKGAWPPPDAVMVEEFVNAFSQGYPEVGDADFGIFLDGAPSPFSTGCQLLRVGLRARGAAADSSLIVARGARVRVAFDPEMVVEHRLIGFDVHRPTTDPVRDGQSIRAGHQVTALYEVRLARRRASGRVVNVRVEYARADASPGGTVFARLDASQLYPHFETAPARFRLDAAVAEFAEVLKRYPWTAGHTIGDVVPMVRQLASELHADPDVVEFADLVERAAAIEGEKRANPPQ